ncbi:MAG: hypothetical protein PHT57_14680 [Rhodoferax sp.]|nr:hypothetical protein [Rhodoferax sp.]
MPVGVCGGCGLSVPVLALVVPWLCWLLGQPGVVSMPVAVRGV